MPTEPTTAATTLSPRRHPIACYQDQRDTLQQQIVGWLRGLEAYDTAGSIGSTQLYDTLLEDCFTVRSAQYVVVKSWVFCSIEINHGSGIFIFKLYFKNNATIWNKRIHRYLTEVYQTSFKNNRWFHMNLVFHLTVYWTCILFNDAGFVAVQPAISSNFQQFPLSLEYCICTWGTENKWNKN